MVVAMLKYEGEKILSRVGIASSGVTKKYNST
jgi:hypothetical protein